MAKKSKKIKIPKSVLDLKLSPKKFAKKHQIRVNGKHMSKKTKKRNKKRLRSEYSEHALNGLNKAVKILAENSIENKKVRKVRSGVDNIISNPTVMKDIAKLYKKHPSSYPNMIYLPNMIMNTITYYNREGISEEEKEIGENLNTEALVEFCEKILKKEIKRYKNKGLSKEMAYQMATAVPTTKLFKRNNRNCYKNLIQTMYDMAATYEVNVDTVLKAVIKIDKKNSIDKKEFLEAFFSEFILKKYSNKNQKFTDSQKDLHEDLIERCLIYLNGLKPRKLREILKQYIKRRKSAEAYKNDAKRVIKFIDYANSNSEYNRIKSVVQELIDENASNELYLS